jgi:hypothetical protein
MEVTTDHKLGNFMVGLSPRAESISPEERLECFTELAAFAYYKRPFPADADKRPSAAEIIARIKSNLERQTRNQQLSDALFPFGILVNGFTSSSSSSLPAAATGGFGGP